MRRALVNLEMETVEPGVHVDWIVRRSWTRTLHYIHAFSCRLCSVAAAPNYVDGDIRYISSWCPCVVKGRRLFFKRDVTGGSIGNASRLAPRHSFVFVDVSLGSLVLAVVGIIATRPAKRGLIPRV